MCTAPPAGLLTPAVCLVSQLHRPQADAGGPAGEVCAQNTQPGGGGLLVLDAGLRHLAARRSEAAAGRTAPKDAAGGRVSALSCTTNTPCERMIYS